MLNRFLTVLLIIGLFTGCSSKEEADNQANRSQVKEVVVSEILQEWGDAPDFTAVKLDGGEFRLSSLKGKVIILNFWSVDCPACKMQIPDLMKLYGEYNDSGLEVIGISLDSAFLIQSYIEQAKKQGMVINYTLLLGNREFIRKYGKELRFLPTTFIIDKAGNIEEKLIGAVSKKELGKKIKKLLDE